MGNSCRCDNPSANFLAGGLKEQPDVIIHRVECTHWLLTAGPVVGVYSSSGGCALYIWALRYIQRYTRLRAVCTASPETKSTFVYFCRGERSSADLLFYQSNGTPAGRESKQITFRAFLFLNPCDVILFCQVGDADGKMCDILVTPSRIMTRGGNHDYQKANGST